LLWRFKTARQPLLAVVIQNYDADVRLGSVQFGTRWMTVEELTGNFLAGKFKL
jgi:hypothetical protein